ncbi:MAG: dienelactone hydrolase family protein [Lysobacterales bacterium]
MTATLYAMDNSNSAHNENSGELLDYVEVTTADNPSYSVIWLHGLGADGHDFEPIVPFLGLSPGTSVRFIFPHALMRPVTVNGGAVMRAWYDIIEISSSKGQDESGIRHSAGKVRALIDLEVSRGIPASRIILAGFSQGGAMALHVGLRYPEKLAGIMALSAYLLFPERLQSEASKANSRTPVFIGHGTQDPVVPFPLGQAVVSALQAGSWPVEWHSYPIPHSVSQPEISDIGGWMQGCFS